MNSPGIVTQQAIDIRRIPGVLKGEVKTGFRRFKNELDTRKSPGGSAELWIQHRCTDHPEIVLFDHGICTGSFVVLLVNATDH